MSSRCDVRPPKLHLSETTWNISAHQKPVRTLQWHTVSSLVLLETTISAGLLFSGLTLRLSSAKLITHLLMFYAEWPCCGKIPSAAVNRTSAGHLIVCFGKLFNSSSIKIKSIWTKISLLRFITKNGLVTTQTLSVTFRKGSRDILLQLFFS